MLERYHSIDIVKSIAIFSVILLHFLLNSGFYDSPINSPLKMIYVIARDFSISAVPLFIMATGFLNCRKEISKRYFINIYKVLFLYLFISIFTIFISNILLKKHISLIDGLYSILDYSGIEYAWYVEMFIGLYLISPILNAAWWSKINRDYHIYIVSIFTTLCILPSFFNMFGKIFPDWWVNTYPIGYYYIGTYVYTYSNMIHFTKIKKILCVLSVCIVILMDIFNSINHNYISNSSNDYYGYKTAIISIILFITIIKYADKGWNNSIFKYISNHTLQIYLLSYITDSLIYNEVWKMIPKLDDRLALGPFIILISFLFPVSLTYISGLLVRITNLLIHRGA